MKIVIDNNIENSAKDDKMALLKLERINPNGQYGTYVIEKGLTTEQRTKIENILGITLKDYRFIV